MTFEVLLLHNSLGSLGPQEVIVLVDSDIPALDKHHNKKKLSACFRLKELLIKGVEKGDLAWHHNLNV